MLRVGPASLPDVGCASRSRNEQWPGRNGYQGYRDEREDEFRVSIYWLHDRTCFGLLAPVDLVFRFIAWSTSSAPEAHARSGISCGVIGGFTR
jgi:hypothetical protein